MWWFSFFLGAGVGSGSCSNFLAFTAGSRMKWPLGPNHMGLGRMRCKERPNQMGVQVLIEIMRNTRLLLMDLISSGVQRATLLQINMEVEKGPL